MPRARGGEVGGYGRGMRLDLPFDEALVLGRDQIPPFVSDLTCEDDTVYATIHLGQVPNLPSAVQLAARFAPQVHVGVRYESFVAGKLGLRVTVKAGRVPVGALLGFAEGAVRTALRARGLPGEAVSITAGEGDPLVTVDVEALAAAKAPGLHVTRLVLDDATLQVEAGLDPAFRLPRR